MIRATIVLAALLLATPAEAKRGLTYDNDGRITQAGGERTAGKRVAKHHRHSRTVRHVHRDRSVSLVGVVGPLALKAREIVAQCGSVVVSAVARRGNRSNHPGGRAVDLRGNPRCIYKLLVGWPGGVSTDYWTAPGGPHVHVSYSPGGQEWGLRFAHRNPFIRRVRHARLN